MSLPHIIIICNCDLPKGLTIDKYFIYDILKEAGGTPDVLKKVTSVGIKRRQTKAEARARKSRLASIDYLISGLKKVMDLNKLKFYDLYIHTYKVCIFNYEP